MRKPLLALLVLTILLCAGLFTYFALRSRPAPTRRDALGHATTLAGSGRPGVEDGLAADASFSDPFGIAVDSRGNLIVADGGGSNRIRKITPEGRVETIAGSEEGFADGQAQSASFNTPSGIAVTKDGDIIIADTSNNRIRKLTADGRVSTIAGSGAAGHKDGLAQEANFDGPIGVAADDDGNIFVADSYNDRIRKISADGTVTTVAGAGSPGLRDGPAQDALFDTPCGVAIDHQGNLFVADTANHAVRKITPGGEVETIAGGDYSDDEAVHYNRPVAVAITHDGFLFVSDEGRSRISLITPERERKHYAGSSSGFADDSGPRAKFNGPSGIAVDKQGNVYVADTKNYLIRRLTPIPRGSDEYFSPPSRTEIFIQPPVENGNPNLDSLIPNFTASILIGGGSFPWPLNPQNQWHEVTGVVGEARGAPGGIALHHLHSGLDVRGNMGDPVVSILDEKISSPVASWDYGGANEGIEVGLMSYIHIRAGRNAKDEIVAKDKFKPRLDEAGELIGIRARRGARFKVGELIGTLNRLYHVHLNFGPWNAQANPIKFPFVNLKDTVAPKIEPGGIEVFNASGQPFKQKRGGRLVIAGDVDIVLTAYDTIDGNRSGRKLGLYRAGYQLLSEDGSPVRGFEQPLMNIEFNRLPPGDESVFVVYAEGSGVSAYGTPTKFKYIVTNRVRDGEARDGLLRTPELASGNYTLRVIAEDYAGNRASNDLPVTINNP